MLFNLQSDCGLQRLLPLVRSLLRGRSITRSVSDGGRKVLRRTGWILGLLVVAPLGAQEQQVEDVDLPRGVAEEIISFFNRPETVRFHGRAEIPAGRVVVGDVAVLGGPLLLAGEVEGDVVVVNGNLQIAPGGRISGDATVLGGRADAAQTAIGGQLTVFDEPLRYVRDGSGITYDEGRWARWRHHRRTKRSYFSVRVESNYNRVEGLPVLFGPVFQTRSAHPFRMDALAVWKSESGIRIAPDEMGYMVRAEQRFGPRDRFSIGATAHSLVEPIESSGFSHSEASLAAFLLHQDFRDYYGREGISAFARFDDEDARVSAAAEYRYENHSFVPVASPWTIKRNDSPWRPTPLVGEGRLHTVSGSLVLDGRNDAADPTDGWYLEARARAGVGGDLTISEYRLPDPGPETVVSETRPSESTFRSGYLDFRRYARLGPDADIKIRGVLAGSLDGEPLPPQFQHALGGEGSMPGFPVFGLDCGARANLYSVLRPEGETLVRRNAYAGYGCDRVALFQAEYRGTFSFDLGVGSDDWDDDWSWYPLVDLTPSWSVFFDAGRGWSLSEPGSPAFLGPDTETLMDVGLGLLLGDVGLYWAWPLNGDERDVNFFLRIDHRF